MRVEFVSKNVSIYSFRFNFSDQQYYRAPFNLCKRNFAGKLNLIENSYYCLHKGTNDHMSGRKSENIKVGTEVEIVLKKDQPTGELTYGFVKRILTKSKFHPHGIKVMLDDGKVGRVKNIISEKED